MLGSFLIFILRSEPQSAPFLASLQRATHLFSASCKPQHLSHENLFRWQSISLALNCRKHAVTDELGSISIERSRKASSREVTCTSSAESASYPNILRRGLLTVSQDKQRVSFVKMPSNNR